MASKNATLTDIRRKADPRCAEFELSESPLYLLVRASGRYAQLMARGLRTSGIDLLSWRALMILVGRNPSSVSEIAEQSVSALSTMTRVVQRLERKGLVGLRVRIGDARVTDVNITRAGRRCVKAHRRAAGVIYQQAMQGLKWQEVETLKTLMRRLFSNLADLPLKSASHQVSGHSTKTRSRMRRRTDMK